jgi:acetyl-CoA carboxylase biotin carboxyl carrier protein
MATRKKGKLGGEESRGVAAGGPDLEQVERILSFMSSHGLEEFEYSGRGLHIRLKKVSAGSNTVPRSYGAPPLPPEIIVPGRDAGDTLTAAAAEGAAAEVAQDLHIIKSPIVGTFYASPSPGAEPFVKVGDHVEAGQVLCIIEAMKLMNEIEAEMAGEVIRIYVESGQPVEYGESLFALRPGRKK